MFHLVLNTIEAIWGFPGVRTTVDVARWTGVMHAGAWVTGGMAAPNDGGLQLEPILFTRT